MKKIFLSLVFLIIVQINFSQESKKRLTEAEKMELRKKNGKIYYSNSRSTNIHKQITFTSSTEQSESDVKKINVNYYYGKEDTLYKQVSYMKP